MPTTMHNNPVPYTAFVAVQVLMGQTMGTLLLDTLACPQPCTTTLCRTPFSLPYRC